MTNYLSSLRQFTSIAVDTSDLTEIKTYNPKDVTTNPSLILKAAEILNYQKFIDDAILWAKKQSNNYEKQIIDGTDKFLVNIASEILKLISGRISIEIDARLAYDTENSILKAKKILKLFSNLGITNDRVLIKIAATWQGICAAEQLEREGINCNLTLVFSFPQARACAEAGVYLISPFVGRILDWYQIHQNKTYSPYEDPGVIFVKNIYKYYKQHDYKTIIMGASFRNLEEIQELAGCDYLTIPPLLLKKLSNIKGEIKRKLIYTGDIKQRSKRINKFEFLLKHNQDLMAVDNLTEGIQKFSFDQKKLEKIVSNMIS